MIRLIRSRLQVRLIMAFVLVMLIPTALVSSYNLLRARETLLSQISSEQLPVAEARASAAASRIAEGGADLIYVVMDSAVRRYAHGGGGGMDEVASAFQSFLQQSIGRYSGLCLLSPAGVEVVCVRQDESGGFRRVPAEALRSRRDEPYFVGALRQAGIPDGNLIAISGVDLAGAPARALRYSILYPDEQGAPIGVLVLEAPLAPILAALVDPGDGVRTSVLDSDGTYLYHPDLDPSEAGRLSLTEEQPHDAQTILRQESGTIIDSLDRPASFQAFTRVRPMSQSALQWIVIYQQPYAAALGLVYETQVVNAGITTLALVIATLLAHLLSRGIVRPIQALATAAERIGAGDLEATIPDHGRDEIGALGRTLARTVSRLRESLAAAEGRRNEAETLRATTQALGATLDLDRVLPLILTELRKVVPFDSASVQEVRDDTSRIISVYGLVKPAQILGATFPLVAGATPNAEVARTCLPVILDDGPARYPLFNTEPFRADPIRSWLGVPMIFGERLVGMITLDKYEPGFYTSEHARLAAAFAAQSAAAIENARLYEAARRELGDRRRAEAAQARLAAIIEATTDLVGMADLAGRILFLNRAGRRMLGIAPTASLEHIRVPELFPAHLHRWLRGEAIPITLRDGAWSGETLVLDGDGNEIPVSQVMIAHRGPDGRPELISTIVRDMRERRRAEEDLRQAQKMEALGRLAGGMAHDFNNLLTVMLGEAEMVLDDLPPGHASRPSVEQIRQSGTRAAALTRQLLAFSRRQVLQPELVDLNAVIAGMEQLLRRLLGEDIALTIALDPDLPRVRADQGQIEQVVMNLAINARDAMPDGGWLLIETLPSSHDEAVAHHEDAAGDELYAIMVVSDTGLGMDEETRAHIFEPFFTTKPRGKGTGLGLATVHGIVRQSGGRIWFHSEPGHGAIFKIFLPAADGPALRLAAPAPARGSGREQARATTVLLVEDDVDVRGLTRQILAREGFTVLEAGDGPAALALARDHPGPICVLLTDVVMPGGLNGVQLAATFRASRPSTRVVYMSGYTDNALVDRSIAEEGASFIQKPFTPEELVRVLLEALV